MFTLLRKLFSKKQKKENEKMAEEKDVKEKVETEKVETKEEAKVDEKPTENADPKVENKTEEKKDEKVEEKTEENAQPEDESVVETEPEGNGVRISDIVTKDYLAEKFAALEAKFDAVIKENSDLKEKLSFMENKYEDKDFGDISRKGVMTKDKDANSSFDEYSKQFMS